MTTIEGTIPASPEQDIALVAAGSTAIANRLRDLVRRRDSIEQEIRRLEILGGDSPRWDCKRCGYRWKGYNITRPPHHCPRCHSTGWRNAPWSLRCRRPGDPPNPKWRVGKRQKPIIQDHTSQITRAVAFPGSDHAEGVRERLLKLTRSAGFDVLPPPPVSLSSQLREVLNQPVQEEQPERLAAPPPVAETIEPEHETTEPDIPPDADESDLISPEEDQP